MGCVKCDYIYSTLGKKLLYPFFEISESPIVFIIIRNICTLKKKNRLDKKYKYVQYTHSLQTLCGRAEIVIFVRHIFLVLIPYAAEILDAQDLMRLFR